MAKKEFAEAWRGFAGGVWKESINVRDFIHNNYTPYEGDDSFLSGASYATKELWKQVVEGIKIENSTHAPLDFDEKTPTSIVAHDAGYINKELEKIVGLQTDLPLKRAIFPYGGIRMVSTSCDLYGKPISKELEEFFTVHRKTHNQGVFDAYTPDIKLARKTGIITGLPDAYGRGRIIGDYRRIALYGIDFLMNHKLAEQSELDNEEMTEEVIRLREELSEQYRSLMQMKEMASKYGYDISNPACTAQEAVQYTYFGYLAAVKSQNGAAMSLGRVSTFLDIYLERDIANGTLSEDDAQELMDHFVMKLRMVRFLRTPEYDQLFSGDPIWATESVGGMGLDGRTLVTKTSYRLLNTLYTMGASPEPNITVLWSEHLPKAWKRYCSKVSLDSSSIQYENDDLMRKDLNSDDYGIACCVSPMVIGKQMQFFGARANLAKTLLYAINGGKDEKMKLQVTPEFPVDDSEVLDFEKVYSRLDKMMDWLSEKYVSALNIIHYMHDRYSYEAALMALHDRDVKRMMACGIAGLSVTVDSLSAIKYATVRPIRDESGLVIDFDIEGEFPTFGNNDDRVDSIAVDLVKLFMSKLRKYRTYRNSEVTQSILTITSNVVYGNKTGNTPDGRKAGTPFGPGANPMHCRDKKGAIASLNSVSKLPFSCAKDGISYTFSIVPSALGQTAEYEREDNLSYLLDGYFSNDNSREGGQHLNVNVLSRELLEDAVNHPENYPQLTIRVSGYAVRFNSLTAEQQQDVITRTFTESM